MDTNTKHCKPSRALLIVVLTLVMSFAATGCAKVANEEKIAADIQAGDFKDAIAGSEIFDELVIAERNTDKKLGTDSIKCTISTHDSEKSYVKEAEVLYKKDADKNWVIDKVVVKPRNQWDIKPLTGVSEASIRSEIAGEAIDFEGEHWVISEDSISDISILEHNTDLEKLTDSAKIKITLNDRVEKLTSDLELKWSFDDGWVLGEVQSVENTSVELLPGKELNIDEKELINIVETTPINFSSGKYAQDINISGDEIPDFTIDEEIIAEKGTKHTYKCRFTLDKKCAVLNVNAVIVCSYTESGWEKELASESAEIQTMNIEGTWICHAKYGGLYSLVYTMSLVVNDEGVVNGKFNCDIPQKPQISGEYAASGDMDMDNARIQLSKGDWTIKPKYPSQATWKQDIEAVLDIDEGKLYGGDLGFTWKAYIFEKEGN